MTQNTIILIDEFDAHLHIRWQYHLFNELKKLAASQDANLTIIITSHSTEILETYINQQNIVEEEGRLIKGGHLIKSKLE
jgi:predicted ATP-dependent endonuclease of OLD family